MIEHPVTSRDTAARRRAGGPSVTLSRPQKLQPAGIPCRYKLTAALRRLRHPIPYDFRAARDDTEIAPDYSDPFSEKVSSMSPAINVLALVKDGERYVFLYDEQSTSQVLQTLGRYAADPELNFSWYDAAVLSQRVRHLQHDSNHDTNRIYRESA
jgi:hypothetical protein